MRKTPPTFPQELITDPVEFTRRFLINPDGSKAVSHNGQVELLSNLPLNFLNVACCGRQWGKSVSMGWYISWYATVHRNRQVYIIAPTLDQARIIFNEVAHQFRTAELSALVVGKLKKSAGLYSLWKYAALHLPSRLRSQTVNFSGSAASVCWHGISVACHYFLSSSFLHSLSR